MKVLPYLIILTIFTLSCKNKKSSKDTMPNVVLIMADDMGYECLSSYGSLSYQTPNLDSLAANGIRFLKCISQPVCSPSRVKIMTGLYNYRNYEYWGYLNQDQYTFGNLMQDAGYATCIAGKWQLNGLHDREKTPDSDNTTPYKFGFDEYCLWQLTKRGARYSNPLIEQNGEFLDTNEDDYGPDVFSSYIMDFIDRKKDEKFFIYYPMALVHTPFVSTPNSQSWKHPQRRYEKDTSYFKDMVAYADEIVGRIVGKLNALNLDKNTIIIFTADNGTDVSISTKTTNGVINGGKGYTTDAGTHVPLIISWPEMIKSGLVYSDLIEFSDFFPTLADIVNKDMESDGKSFYPLLKGEKYDKKRKAFVHYDPFPFPNYDHNSRSKYKSHKNRGRFVRNTKYKLYQDGRFFDLSKDILEKTPLPLDSLSKEEISIRNDLQAELKKHPRWPKH